jgi:hypothetical protein
LIVNGEIGAIGVFVFIQVPVQVLGPGLGQDQKQLQHVEEVKNVKAVLKNLGVVLVRRYVSIIFTSDPFSKKKLN